MSAKHDASIPREPRHRGEPVITDFMFVCFTCGFKCDGDHYNDSEAHLEENPDHSIYEESIY